MSNSDQNSPSNLPEAPSWKQVLKLISEDQPGFALILIGIIFAFVAVFSKESALFQIGSILFVVVGLALTVAKELSKPNFSKGVQKNTEIADLKRKIEQLNKDAQEKLDSSLRDNVQKDTEIADLKRRAEQLNQENLSHQENLQLTLNKKSLFSRQICDAIKVLHKLSAEKQSPPDVLDVIEYLYDQGFLETNDYQDTVLVVSQFRPTPRSIDPS